MSLKFALCVAAALLALSYGAEARHVASTRLRTYPVENNNDADDVLDTLAGRQPHPASRRGLSHKQARVFPGAVAIKKLVLLKFKKIVPISLILLKSSNENEAELVPVYPTSEIPANVQFIPTPNGISGHKDVQAIAIPSELHEQLEAHGLANIENIEALLNDAAEVPSDDENTVSVVSALNADEPLNVNESDVNQLLSGAVAAEEAKPLKIAAPTSLRRLAADETSRPSSLGSIGLRTGHRTTVEDIPLFLYSAKDAPVLHHNARLSGLRLATSNGSTRRHLLA